MTLSIRRVHAYTPALVTSISAIIPLLLYLRTRAPGITWRFGGSDSAELATAAASFGVPHPTGYPLYLLLCRIATLVPFGEVAARTNVLSALCAAAAAGITALTAWTLTRNLPGAATPIRAAGAVLGALLAGTSNLYWSQAIITEVYALHALLCSLIFFAWSLPGRHPVLRGLLHGLSLTHHLTAATLLGGRLIALLWRVRTHRTFDTRAAVLFVAAFLPPLLLYALLPLRAAADPLLNWGDPDSPGRFWDHITGAAYRPLLRPTDIAGRIPELLSLLRLLVDDLGPWTLVFALLGGIHLRRARPEFLLTAGAAAILLLRFTSMYRGPDHASYLLPLYLMAGILAGTGITTLLVAILARATTPRRARVAASAMLAAILFVAAGRVAEGWSRVSLRGDDGALVFARATLAALPPDATYYSARDDVTFALWYAQAVHDLRPDVTVVDVRNPAIGLNR